jgi:hypothetical protein
VFVCDETGTCTTAVRDLSEVMSGAWLEGVVFGIDMGLRSGVPGRGLVLGRCGVSGSWKCFVSVWTRTIGR